MRRLTLLSFLSVAFWLGLQCHLEPLEDTDPCSDLNADFTLSAATCELPCNTITIKKEKIDGAAYEWQLDGVKISELQEPTADQLSQKLTTPGKVYTLKLIVRRGTCEATQTKTLTVGSVLRFSLPLANLVGNVEPLYATQLSNGNFHCLYFRQNEGLRSVTITPSKTVGTPSPIYNTSSAYQNTIALRNGGFAVSRGVGGRAEVTIISGSQTLVANPALSFNGTEASAGGGIAENTAGQILLTGNRTISATGVKQVGFTTITGSGTPQSPLVFSAQAGYFGTSVVQRLNGGEYWIATYPESLSGSAQLMRVNGSGNVGNVVLTPLVYPTKIIHVGNDVYVVIGRSSASKYYVLGISAAGALEWTEELEGWTRVADVVYSSSDNTIVVCGTKGTMMQAAKYRYKATAAEWERSYNEATGQAEGRSVVNTTDGGYLFCAKRTDTGGATMPYLVKTDGSGTP